MFSSRRGRGEQKKPDLANVDGVERVRRNEWKMSLEESAEVRSLSLSGEQWKNREKFLRLGAFLLKKSSLTIMWRQCTHDFIVLLFCTT